MSFMRGKDYKVFITTENSAGSLLLTGTATATTSSGLGPGADVALKGIGKLGEVGNPNLATASRIMNVEGIDPVWRWEDDPVTVFGQTRPLDNPVRQRWEITITRRAEDTLFGKLNQSARFGVTGSSPAIFDGLYTMPDDTGYRIYVWNGSKYWVGCHGTLTPDGYKETLTPTGITAQAITFAGGVWYADIASDSAALSASQDISQ